MTTQEILVHAYQMIREKNLVEDSLIKVQALAGDASLRQYYRIQLSSGETYVLMLTEPYRFLENNFLLIQSRLEKNKIACPGVKAYDEKKGAILLEDLGDRTMLHELNAAMDSMQELELFQGAIQLLVDFHKRAKTEPQENIIGFSQAFDEEKLMWEVNFTFEHLFKNYLKRNIPVQVEEGMKDAFRDICKRLEAEPRVFTHRDYHSRNIMLREGGEMVCIDFQDARMGLRQYDLASILRDSYYQLSDERVYELVRFYVSTVKSAENITLNEENFIRLFDLMSIQRNFKAIGSFTSFYANRGNVMYLRFIGNTFENIRKNLMKFPEYKHLLKDLYEFYYF